MSLTSVVSIMGTRYAPCGCSPPGKLTQALRPVCARRQRLLDDLRIRRHRTNALRHRAGWSEQDQLHVPWCKGHGGGRGGEGEDVYHRFDRLSDASAGDRSNAWHGVHELTLTTFSINQLRTVSMRAAARRRRALLCMAPWGQSTPPRSARFGVSGLT